MAGGQVKDGEPLREVFFHPCRQLGSLGNVFGDDGFETRLSRWAIGRVKDGANVLGDLGTEFHPRNVSLSVLLKMKLTPLPRNRRKHSSAGRPKSFMIIADDVGDALKASLLEAGEELPPMGLCLAESCADTEDGAFTVLIDAEGNEDGAVDEAAAVADLFVACIQDEIGEGSQRTGPPSVELDVELGGALADLRGTDRSAAKFFDDGGHFAGGDALNIHFCQGELEGLLAADTLLQRGRVELYAWAHLRDLKGNGAKAGGESLGFETISLALTGVGALVGLSLEHGRALATHGLVDEEADAFGKTLVALFSEELQNGIQEFRVGLVGHVWCCVVGCVSRHPNTRTA